MPGSGDHDTQLAKRVLAQADEPHPAGTTVGECPVCESFIEAAPELAREVVALAARAAALEHVADPARHIRVLVETFADTRLTETEFGRLYERLWPILVAVADALVGLDKGRMCECDHPRGWHFRSAGSCLECGCLEFRDAALAGLDGQ